MRTSGSAGPSAESKGVRQDSADAIRWRIPARPAISAGTCGTVPNKANAAVRTPLEPSHDWSNRTPSCAFVLGYRM